MKNKKEILFFIPARKNSSRIKNKNLKNLGNKSLLKIKISQCKSLKIGKVVVSTDSKRIAKKSYEFGADYVHMRPKKYSQNSSSTMSVILDFLRQKIKDKKEIPEFISICHLTNPFVTNKSIKNAYLKICQMQNFKFDSIISYSYSEVHPFLFINVKKKINFDIFKMGKKKYSDIERSQDRPVAFTLNSAIKITRKRYFLKYIKNLNHKTKIKPFNLKKTLGLKIKQIEAYDINKKSDLVFANIINSKSKRN